MINRIKAHLRVYGRHIEVIGVLAAMILSGWIGGYMMRGAELADIVASIRIAHTAEVERLQAGHKDAYMTLMDRLDGIAAKQESAATKVGDAAVVAKQAAGLAKGAVEATRPESAEPPAAPPRPRNMPDWNEGGG